MCAHACVCVCVCVCALMCSAAVGHLSVHNDWSPRDHRRHRSDRVPQMVILVACPWLIRVFHGQMSVSFIWRCRFLSCVANLAVVAGSVHTCTCIIDSPKCDSHGTCFDVIARLRNVCCTCWRVLVLWMVFPWCTTPRSTQLLSRRHVVIALLNGH